MNELHWLPIRNRIEFKILFIAHKALHDLAPLYLSNLLQKRPNKETRSDNKFQLIIPRESRKTFGGRTFTNVAPTLWSNLPFELLYVLFQI